MSLEVAVVGLGVGEAHARAYAAHPGCHIRWLLDLDAAKASRVASELAQGAVAPTYGAILDDPEVNLVSLATYDDDHHVQTVAALRAGKHVFVEKPICQTLAELREIKAAWAGSSGRVQLSSNMVLRAAPLYAWLRGAIAAGELGRPYAIDADYLYGRVEKLTKGWRRDVKDYSVMAGGGIHLIDLLLWTLGTRPDRVQAEGNHIATAGTPFLYDDYVAAHLRFPDGLVARVTANFGCVHRHQHAVRVFATAATFLHDDAGPRLHRSRSPDTPPERLAYAPHAHDKGALVGPFVDAILRGDDLRTHTQGIFDAMSVCAAIDRSRETGQPIGVEYA